MESIETFQCDKCIKVFPSFGRFNQHLKTHTKPYPCEECNKSFALRADLSRHVRARHRTGQSMHACVVHQCSFKATRKDNIRQHIRNAHPEHSLPPPSYSRKRKMTNSTSLALPLVPSDAPEDVQASQRHAALPTLMQAASTRNIVLLQAMLNLGVDVSVQADDGSTALHCAAQANQVEMIRYLLAAGAKMDITNNRKRTPLHEAVFSKCHSAFLFLLQNGSNISAMVFQDIIKHSKNQFLETALATLGTPWIDVHGRDLFRTAARLNSVLCMATVMSSTEINRDWIFNQGHETVYYAIMHGRVAIIKLLLDSSKLDPNLLIEGYRIISLLQLAASCGHLEIVKLLLACKEIDINRRDERGHSALHKAATNGKHEIVNVLLQLKEISVSHEDIAFRSKAKAKELHVAAQGGHTAVFELILNYLDRRDISIDQLDMYGQTPLEVAVARGRVDIVKLLIRRQSIRCHNPGFEGRALLDLVTRNDQLQMLQFLLEDKEIDLDRGPDIVNSLLKQAALGLHFQIVAYLLEHQNPAKNYRSDKTWDIAGASQNARIMKRLLDEEPLSINWVDATGVSLLSRAVRRGNASITALLLDHDDIKINLPDISGSTPLHCAVEERWSLDSLQLLLNHKDVLVNHMDNSGNTAMHRAILWGKFEAAKLICRHQDFEVDTRWRRSSSYGLTALAFAKRFGRHDIVELLLQVGAKDLESLEKVPSRVTFENVDVCQRPKHLLDPGSEAEDSETPGPVPWTHATTTGDEDMENNMDFVAHELDANEYELETDQDMVKEHDEGEEYWGPYGLSSGQKQHHVSWEL